LSNSGARRAIIITAVVLIGLAVVAFGFYQFGRSTVTPPMPPSSSTGATPSTTVVSPTYSPTDQNGSPEPALPRGPATAGTGGTTTGPAALPLGYTHDRTGAVNAATNYLIWMNSIRITGKKTADQMAASSAVDEATRTALISSFDMLRSGMENLTADQPEPVRGAYAIARYSDSRAVIYVWAPEVTTDANGRTGHLWAIDAVPLVWSSGDWKLDKALIAKTGGAAVDPSDPTGNPTAQEKHSILTRTPADPGEIRDSADQSWFEYSNAPH
jgi:hypothetical protein